MYTKWDKPISHREFVYLFGPFIGELHWECFRFAPHAIYLKKKDPNRKIVVLTRPDRFDLYGRYCNILVPLKIPHKDGYQQNCFGINNFPDHMYLKMVEKFRSKFEQKYNISGHFFPKVAKQFRCVRWQFPRDKMVYDFKPRPDNYQIINNAITTEKPVVILAPRFRKQERRRNWPFWKNLYKTIQDSKIFTKFTWVICGKKPDYVPDPLGIFFDINNFKLTLDSSLIGLTIAILEKAVLTIGSQSGIPNLSKLLKVPTLEWGHERQRHMVRLNPLNTPTTFLESKDYRISEKEVFSKIEGLLRGKIKHEIYM